MHKYPLPFLSLNAFQNQLGVKLLAVNIRSTNISTAKRYMSMVLDNAEHRTIPDNFNCLRPIDTFMSSNAVVLKQGCILESLAFTRYKFLCITLDLNVDFQG